MFKKFRKREGDTNTHTDKYVYVDEKCGLPTYICVLIHTCIYIYIHMYIYSIYIYICIYIVYVYMYIYICIYIYIYITYICI